MVMSGSISHHVALIYTMVLVSASDQEMSDRELHAIGEIISDLPIFRDYDDKLLPSTTESCAELLAGEEGLDRAFDLICNGLPVKLRETAYALACDVAAADGEVSQEELQMLQMIRHRLELGRLIAAGIERGARARFATL